MTLALQHFSQLAGMGGFTGALQTAHHHNTGRTVGGSQPDGLAAHKLRQFLIDDFDDHLGWGQAFHHLCPHRPGGNGGGKVLGDLIVHIGLQQRQAYLPHGLLHVGLAELAFGPQPLKGSGQFVGQSFKRHIDPPLTLVSIAQNNQSASRSDNSRMRRLRSPISREKPQRSLIS